MRSSYREVGGSDVCTAAAALQHRTERQSARLPTAGILPDDGAMLCVIIERACELLFRVRAFHTDFTFLIRLAARRLSRRATRLGALRLGAMATRQDRLLSDRVRRLLGSLEECSDAVRDEHKCSRACRGQVRPAGEAAEQAASELEEMNCTLAGRKPITLLHRFFPEAQSLAHLCRAGILQQAGERVPPVRSGPTLIFVEDPHSRARALAAGE